MRTIPYSAPLLGLVLSGLVTLAAGACGGSGPGQAPTATTGGAPPGFSSGGTGNVLITIPDGGEGGENPCLGPNPPDNCQLVPSGPACGDGQLDAELEEECDDGNALPGDGCSGRCRVEPNFTCPTPGERCESNFECGNGLLEPGEVCDDGNTEGDDGCSADCTEQSRNFRCATPGEACTRVVFCGDGRVAGDETCEDGNTESDDGCDADCNVETGWLCPLVGESCERYPMCGDGQVTPSLGEVCDDGNTRAGDGCAADCTFIEGGFSCATPGAACVNLNVCGDGRVTGDETCDDGNTRAGDGCDGSCKTESGYECPYPGAPCIFLCGDGLLRGNEVCDDGNRVDDDGCTNRCLWGAGWACTGTAPSYDCERTTCGDGRREGTESCDDGNGDLGDGCTPLCQVEPTCTAQGCTSNCGDGLVLGGEACDDGNNRPGDGCSATCTVEPGYECEQPPLGESMQVPVVYRDFRASHVDFEPGATGCNEVSAGMVAATLDGDGKPALAATAELNKGGCNHVTSAASFRDWYRDSSASETSAGVMVLYDNGSGGYVNRWGPNGEQWALPNPSDIQWCADDAATADCSACGFIYDVCYDPCTPWGADNKQVCALGAGGMQYYEGDPFFFPLDASTFDTARSTAVLPPPYGGWGDEPGDPAPEHNFHFTSEVRFWFAYQAGTDQLLEFTGDDDVWVFINRQRVVDLGGIHVPLDGAVNVRTAAASLGLVSGKVYEIVVFQAERQTAGSSYKLTLSGFNASASVCGPICGDGVVSPGEACDDGVNAGGYGSCSPDCTRGAYCGDGIVQADHEDCDNGQNLDGYAVAGGDACAPGCRAVPFCGDGVVQTEFGERCDDGVNDGQYGGCTPDCQRAPFCGDGRPDPAQGEECDDGLNNGAYDTCAPGCVLGPRCGDGVLAEAWGEICDDGNTLPGDGCSATCGPEGICGDALVEPDKGEQCDDGVNDGGYGECGPSCLLGPHCGDGTVQPDDEQCDDGVNAGGYGECAAGCVLGPHCGDGREQAGYEECDDGNASSGDGCTPTCKLEVPILR